jgi:hypothetical protein
MSDPESTPFADRKLGSFAMPIQWVEGMKNKDAEELFKHFRIVRAEIDYSSQSILYVAASEFFDSVPANEMAPGYRIMLDSEAGKLNIRVAKL